MKALSASILTVCLALTGTAASAQSSADEKLAYVASVAGEGVFFCSVKPRSRNTSETFMRVAIALDGEGPVEADVIVTGVVSGSRYSARISFRGIASAEYAGDNGESGEAVITLNEVTSFDADSLPGDAEWSDPEGDVIELRVADFVSRGGDQRFILRGTQVSEFGTNDVSCLDSLSR
jgi:hypothetical protein